MNLTFQGTNLELNEDIRTFVQRKLDDCFRAFGDMNLEPVQVDVLLERTTRRHPLERETDQLYRAEANVSVPGRLIRVEGTASELTQAVVKMKRKLFREIRTWRERRIDDTRSGARSAKKTFLSGPLEEHE